MDNWSVKKSCNFSLPIYSLTRRDQVTSCLSSSRYPTINLSSRPIHLHQVLTPMDLKLNLNKYRKKTEIVSEETMAHLEICQKTIAEAKDIIRYGSGNQVFSIIDTEGESTIRNAMCRESTTDTFSREGSTSQSSRRTVEQKIKYAMQYQAGHCSEVNSITFGILTQKKLNAPLLRMTDREEDHTYTLIGDPRVSKWGENTVVVDAWPICGTAYTLKQALHNIYTNQHVVLEYPASISAPQSIKKLLEQKYETVNTSLVNQYLDQESLPNIGNELIEFLYEKTSARDVRVGAKDPSTRYQIKGEAPRTFDDISMQDLKKYRIVQAKAEQFLSTHPNWDIQQTSKSHFFSYLKGTLSSKSSKKDD